MLSWESREERVIVRDQNLRRLRGFFMRAFLRSHEAAPTVVCHTPPSVRAQIIASSSLLGAYAGRSVAATRSCR